MREADIILVRGRTTPWWDPSTAVSRGIVQATGCEDDGPSHAAVAINDKECIEALSRVRRNSVNTTLAGCEKAWLCSCETLSDAERQQIAFAAMAMEGLSYGYFELGVQLADSIFRTTWFTDHWSANLNSTPICSYIPARTYDICCGMNFGKEDQSITPGDIYRYARLAENLHNWTVVQIR